MTDPRPKPQDQLRKLAHKTIEEKRLEIKKTGYDLKPEDQDMLVWTGGDGERIGEGRRYNFNLTRVSEPPDLLGYHLISCDGDTDSMTVYNVTVHWEHFVKTALET